MAKKTSVQIGSLSFGTKKEAKNHIRAILNEYEDNQRIEGADDSFLRELICLHPECDAKIGAGISYFTVQRDQEWGKTHHFVLIRVDGTSTDFSFLTCIDGTNQRQDIYDALRHSVSSQIIKFKQDAFSQNLPLTCFYRKRLLTELDADVDHEPPHTFLTLVNDWLKTNGLSIDALELVDNADNQWARELRDRKLIESWRDYHSKNAKLRVISKEANRSDARKKK